MNTTPSSSPSASSTTTHGRALVLAGAGATGNAWEIGLVAGLSEGEVDLTEADVIIGTSAGSTVAAQITSGRAPVELFADILAAPPLPPRGDAGPGSAPPSSRATLAYLEWSDRIIASAADASDMRRRIGAAALEITASDVPGGARWRDIVAARLPSRQWPAQRVLIAAVDARTGEPVVFDRHSGVDLVDAVAASTSNGFRPFGAYRIGEDRYVNGGYRRSENADLAAGYARVLVLSPFGGRSRTPREWGMDLATQVEELRAGGSRVETIVPGADAEHLFGAAAMDVSLRPAAARAGHDQGWELAERLAAFWR